MELTFVGCGDAFGSGGRFNTCFHVQSAGSAFLVDCGSSALISMKRLAIDPSAIDSIFITHFHADHFSGLPFLVLDAQFSKRTRPLSVLGPTGLRDPYRSVMEAAFPGTAARTFKASIVELPADTISTHGAAKVLAKPVVHGLPATAFFGYRIWIDNRVIAYTGDTEWTDNLIELGRDADLLIAGCYYYDRPIPFHLSYRTLLERLATIAPKRLVLTRMSDDMLRRSVDINHERAIDGLKLTL